MIGYYGCGYNYESEQHGDEHVSLSFDVLESLFHCSLSVFLFALLPHFLLHSADVAAVVAAAVAAAAAAAVWNDD